MGLPLGSFWQIPPWPLHQLLFTPCCSPLCVPLCASASMLFFLLFSLLGMCTSSLTQFKVSGQPARSPLQDPLQQVVGGRRSPGQWWEGQGTSVTPCPGSARLWLMTVWGPDFGFGDRHTSQDLGFCHLVLSGKSGAPQTQKSKVLQSPGARERGEKPPQAL